MATNRDKVEDDLQEAARAVLTGAQVAAGVRNEVINTGEHILDGITSPVKNAISQGSAATLSYAESLLPATQLSNVAETLTKAALGDEAAKARAKNTIDTMVNIAEALPKGVGENVARGELAAKSGNAFEFGGALGAIAMMSIGGPEGKAAEAAASGITRVVEGELVDSAMFGGNQTVTTAKTAATEVAELSVESSVATPVTLSIPEPKYTPVTTALDNSNLPDAAKQALKPVAYVLDEAKGVVLSPKPSSLTEHMNQAVSESYKRDNIFKEALDRNDGGHIDARTGLTIAEATHYHDWNKAQVPARAEFYKDVFAHRPELATKLEQQGITVDGVNKLLMSDMNDHLIGIKPYGTETNENIILGGRGHSAERALAKEWDIEFKEQREGWGGVLQSMKQDLTGKYANQELYEAKEAVEAAARLEREVHADTAKRILVPELPRNPELDAKVQQLLVVQLENGTLSSEARQALPAELRALPTKHLEALQEKAQQAVATDHLRLSADRQTTPLISGNGHGAAKAETNMVAADYDVMSQAIRDSFNQSLSVVNHKAAVAEIVPLTEAQIAAKQKVAEFTEGKSTVAVATRFVIDTAAGSSGVGYNFGQLELAKIAEKASVSDYAALKTMVETGLKKTATTLAVAGTAVVAPAALPVGFAGVVATRMVANNETATAAIKGLAVDAKDYVIGAVNGMRSPQRDALVETLPKSADGKLTPQSQKVLELVDERVQSEHFLASQELER